MHGEPSDELCIGHSNGASGLAFFKALALNTTCVSVTEIILLLEIANLCVQRPRYSIALPKPLKVSSI